MQSFLDIIKKNLFFKKNKKAHKIYDCCLFLNENDLFEVRINELKDVVDYFVIVESKCTFTKQEKSFNFDLERFKQFKNKIIYIQNQEYVKSPNPWETEKQQRNKIMDGLNLPYLNIRADPEDMILLSDLDEIPKKDSIINAFYQIYSKNKSYIRLNLKSFRYALNNQMITDEQWQGTICARMKNITTMQDLRRKNDGISNIDSAGWHYSYLGSPENIIYKIKSYSHKENDKWPNNDLNFITERINKGFSSLGHEECLFKRIHLNTKNSPKYILKNKHKYDKLIFKNEKTSIWTQITSLYNKKICQIKKYTMGLRNKSS